MDIIKMEIEMQEKARDYDTIRRLYGAQAIIALIAVIVGCVMMVIECRAEETWNDTEEQRRIVAEIIAAEAGGEREYGMRLVAEVIRNRTEKRGTTPYVEATRRKQFYGYTAKNRKILYAMAKKGAESAMRKIYDGTLGNETNGATNFENPKFGDPGPKWIQNGSMKKLVVTKQYRNHIFYRIE